MIKLILKRSPDSSHGKSEPTSATKTRIILRPVIPFQMQVCQMAIVSTSFSESSVLQYCKGEDVALHRKGQIVPPGIDFRARQPPRNFTP